MADRLADKVALITGAGSGLGREMALLFAREGAIVVINDIDEEAGEKTASEIGSSAQFVRGDVSDDGSVAALFEAVRESYGRLDVSVHNAGIMDPRDEGPTVTPLEVWDRVIAINLTGVFLCCRYAIPLMLDTEGNSSIINIASFVALMGCSVPQDAYTMSKGAVISLTRSLAVQYGPNKIRANAICPGPVLTPMMETLFASEAEKMKRLNRIPLGRFGRAEDIVAAGVFLASDESSWMTGQNFVIDGGITVNYF